MAVHADVAVNRDNEHNLTAVTVRTYSGMAAAAGAWRALETGSAVTPYQRYDWIKFYMDACGIAPDNIIIAMFEAEGEPFAAMPLLITHRFGLTIGALPGSDIANTDWLIVRPDMAHLLDRQVLSTAFDAVSRAVGGLDLVRLSNLPESWNGVPDPFFAFPHQPAPDPLYFGGVAADVARTRPPARRLRNVQRGRRRLEETYGPVVLKRARTAEEVQAFHAAFQVQRDGRFRKQGIRNIFAERRFVDFFARAGSASVSKKTPTLCLHALYAGKEIVAVSIGTFSGAHYSQYIHSVTEGEAARASLMSILIEDLLGELAAEGVRTFDMGLGEFRYKNDWTEPQIVYDCAIGFTATGRLAAHAFLAQRRMKRTIKHNPKLWTTAKALRTYINNIRWVFDCRRQRDIAVMPFDKRKVEQD